MPTLHERVETALPVNEVFSFVADFANSPRWDPGTATSERLDDGPLGVGARYHLGVRMAGRVAPMEYRIVGFDEPHQVVLEGSGSGVNAVDDIRFEPTASGTIVDYTANLRLTGLLRLLQPLLGRAFDSIGRNAAAGMRRAFAEMEAGRPAPASAADAIRDQGTRQ